MRTYRGTIAGVPWVGRLVERAEDLDQFLQWSARMALAGQAVAFDTEARGLRWAAHGPDYLRLAQFGTKTDAWVVPVEHGPAFRAAALKALTDASSLLGHNVIGFDGLVVDKHLGFKFEDMCAKASDTLVTSKLIDPRGQDAGGIGASLKQQSAKYVDPAAPDTQEGLTAVFKSLKVGHTKDNGLGWHHVPWNHPIYVVYSMLDVVLASHLAERHHAEVERLSIRKALIPYEHEILRMCGSMSRRGMLIDQPYTEGLRGVLAEQYAEYAAKALRYGVDSVGSSRKVAAALQAMGEVWEEKTDSGAPSTAKEVLMPMADLDEDWERIGARTPNPLADAVLHAKRASKWRVSYVEKFLSEVDENGYLHANINTLEARTGRMSVTGPALQQLPSGDHMIRRCLLAEEDSVFISTDFSAIELRVLAALANVRRMKDGFASGDHEFDIHMYTAKLAVGEGAGKRERKLFKKAGLGKVYGSGVKTMARQTGTTAAQMQRVVEAYERNFPEVKRYSDRKQAEAFDNGMLLYTRTGRRQILDRSRTYAVVNYMCQSTARDVLGQAMLNMDKAGLLQYMRLPIHDEILSVAPREDAEEIGRELAKCMTFSLDGVPITSSPDIGGRSWGSLYGASE